MKTVKMTRKRRLQELTGLDHWPPTAKEIKAQARERAAETARLLKDPKLAGIAEQVQERYVLARELSRARKRAGLTQVEVAKRIGTTQSQIARIEGGFRNTTIATLYRYAQACDATVDVRLRAGRVTSSAETRQS